jgi:DNA replication protein DnaC
MTWLDDGVKKALFDYLSNIGQNIESGHGLVVCGPYGVGKSAVLALVAMATLHYWKEKDVLAYRSARYMTAYELCRSCAKNDEHYSKTKNLSLLLIDDFGAEYSHDWPLSTLNAIIDYRYMNYSPTCLSTNISSARLANAGSDEYARYGRIIDRMNEAKDFLLVEIDAASQRK